LFGEPQVCLPPYGYIKLTTLPKPIGNRCSQTASHLAQKASSTLFLYPLTMSDQVSSGFASSGNQPLETTHVFVDGKGDGMLHSDLTARLNSDDDESPSVVLTPPPDGGTKAWAQVVMGHLILINGWGYLSSFGLYESYYTTSLSLSPSSISWIGSVQIFLVYAIGTFSGRALDAGHYHTVQAAGSFLQILGIFMTSVSTKYWQIFLAQGVCKGLGDGLVFCPTVSLVATYFSKKRSLAMAFTASGGATGGIIFPLIFQQLEPRLGFGWAVRIMGFVVLFNAVAAAMLARVRLPPRKTGPLVEWSAFKELPYTLFCVGMFFNLWAVYFAYFYVSQVSSRPCVI
jgi:hypothetical protein